MSSTTKAERFTPKPTDGDPDLIGPGEPVPPLYPFQGVSLIDAVLRRRIAEESGRNEKTIMAYVANKPVRPSSWRAIEDAIAVVMEDPRLPGEFIFTCPCGGRSGIEQGYSARLFCAGCAAPVVRRKGGSR